MLRTTARPLLIAIALVLAGLSPALATDAAQPVQAMSLEQALRYARAHQPQIRSALAELQARYAEAKIPRAEWMPRVGAVLELVGGSNNDSTAVFINVREVDLARVGASGGRTTQTARWSPTPSTLAAISLNQEVYDFGRIAASSAVADANAAVASADAEAAQLDVQLAVEEAYHAVLAARDVLGATEEAYKRAVTHRDYAQAGTRSGLRPPIDLTRAQADVAKLEVRRIRAQSGLRVSRAALAASVGSGALEIDADATPDDATRSPSLEEAMRLAGRRNPEIAAASARLDAQRGKTRLITHELMPNLFLSAGASGRAGGLAPASGELPYGSGWLPDVGNWNAGLVLSWNVFDGGVLARRAASKAREEAALANLDLAKVSVALGAERGFLELNAALDALPGLSQSVEAAHANLAQADARFKAGLGNVIELADAENLLTTAQLELAVGQFSVARARAALGRVMGQSSYALHTTGKNR